jgi:anti-sigma factor (TIGR02949 family)
MNESNPNLKPSANSPAVDCGPDCAAVMQQLWEYLDGEVGPEQAAAIRQHLALCAKCYPQYNFEKAFLDALGDCRCETCAPHDLRCKVVEALREAGFTAVSFTA